MPLVALRRRTPSIYEHVRRHLRPDGPGLLEEGENLPDEDEDEIRFAPGAAEGVARYFEAEDEEVDERELRAVHERRVEELHSALVQLADKPGMRPRRRLRRLFRAGGARAHAGDVLARLRAFPPRSPDRLHDESLAIFLETGDREELKWATLVLSACARGEDLDLFRTIGRHPEFTFYAALALAIVSDDPTGEWLDLLRHTSGWGKTELADLLLEDDPSDEVRDAILRDGRGVGNALRLAVGCRLHEFLGRRDVDDELLDAAAAIFDALTFAPEQPEVLSEYPQAGAAAELFLEHVRTRPLGLDRFLTVHGLRSFAAEDPALEPVVALCDQILDRPEWRERALAALEAPDESERNTAIEVAKRLGLPLRDYLVRKIEETPLDPGLWFELVWGADEEQMGEAVALAERVLPLDEIAVGPGDDLGLGEDRPFLAFEFVLQELKRFPGKGPPLIRAALQSPVVRHRRQALQIASGWPRDESWPALEEAVQSCLTDPDEDVRNDARTVLAGEALGDPVDDAASDAGEPR